MKPPDRMPPQLSTADLDVVHETLREIRDMPPPRDNQPVGCSLVLAGLVLLLGLPVLGKAGAIGSGFATPGLLGGGALLVIGVVVWQTAGGFVRGRYIAAAEAALRTLEAWRPEDGDREVALRAATLLLTHAVATYGATAMSTIDGIDARERLRSMMPLVLAVQDVLLAEEASYAVFTDEDEENADHAPS